MPKSYWTKIQTPNGLKYFRADDVTDELLQKIKDEADDVFYVEYGTTTFADAEAAYLDGKTLVCREIGQTVQQTRTDDLYFLIDYMPTAGTYTGRFVFSNITGYIQTNVVLSPSTTYEKVQTVMATRQEVKDTLAAEIAPDYYTVVQKCYDDDSFPIPAGTYVTYLDNTSSSALQYLYKSKVAIERWESGSSSPLEAPQKWDKIKVADELGKTFFATMFTTPYSEIKAAYDSGRSIIAVNGNAFYHMFDLSTEEGHERFRFSLVQGNTFLLWTCNKTGYDGTHGWNPQPDVTSCVKQDDIAPKYSSESTYDVGDLAYDAGILYRCTTAISTPEIWNSNHWTQTTVAAELRTLRAGAMITIFECTDNDMPEPSFVFTGPTYTELEAARQSGKAIMLLVHYGLDVVNDRYYMMTNVSYGRGAFRYTFTDANSGRKLTFGGIENDPTRQSWVREQTYDSLLNQNSINAVQNATLYSLINDLQARVTALEGN